MQIPDQIGKAEITNSLVQKLQLCVYVLCDTGPCNQILTSTIVSKLYVTLVLVIKF